MLSTIQKSKINRPWNSPPPPNFSLIEERIEFGRILMFLQFIVTNVVANVP